MNAIFLTTEALRDEWWSRAEPHIETVATEAARGEFTAQDIKQRCGEGKAITAVVVDGDSVVMAMAFEFIYYPQITACNIIALGGKRIKEIEEQFFITFKSWCYGMGVTVIEASCSSAMTRLLRQFGFEKTYEVVRLKL